MNKKFIIGIAFILAGVIALALTQIEQIDPAAYENAPVYEIEIKDHTFTPDRFSVSANERFKLLVHNRDATPEEFESDDFRREKIIPGNSSATIFVAPLQAGTYEFFGEFNMDTAKGTLVVE